MKRKPFIQSRDLVDRARRAQTAGQGESMTELKTYSGSCHCGKVRYEVKMDLSRPVTACNCSMCGRSGTLLAFAPADQFTLLSGEDAMTNYQFNTKVIHHLFCATCGIKAFARGRDREGNEIRAINVRCLEGVDPKMLTIVQADGRSR